MTRAETLEIQRQLGLKADGIYGPKTHDAYQRWLNENTVESVPTPAPAAAKPWYLSRAVIGILVAMAAVVVKNWGVEVDVEEATTLAVGIGGLVVALIGTIRRRAPIDPTLVLPSVRLNSRPCPLPADRQASKPGPFGY